MDISIAAEYPHRLVATLRDGTEQAVVTSADRGPATASLLAALEATREDGYAECYWHEANGQYWWLFRRQEARLELAVMWSSGPVTGWQHVFRAADEFEYFAERVREAVGGLTWRADRD